MDRKYRVKFEMEKGFLSLIVIRSFLHGLKFKTKTVNFGHRNRYTEWERHGKSVDILPF